MAKRLLNIRPQTRYEHISLNVLLGIPGEYIAFIGEHLVLFWMRDKFLTALSAFH